MPSNTAAWLPAPHTPLEVGPAPYTPPGADEIVVRNRAVAINPLDWIVQVAGRLAFGWIKPPFVLGSDLAGEVVEVGAAVTRFAAGDRVLGHVVGTDKDCNSSARGAFQEYSVVLERLASPIPATMPFEDAAVLPLGLSTAACGLFQQDQLGLRHPSADPAPTGSVVLVWGGSTSVGSNAVQLAVASGYDVVTTASPRNFDYVTGLGASDVFDHNSPDVVREVIAALQGRELAGTLAVGQGSAELCAEIVPHTTGSRFISMASPAVSFEKLARGGRRSVELPKLMVGFVAAAVALELRCRIRRLPHTFIYGTTLKGNEVAKAVYEDFLPTALAEGRFVPAPEPLVVGHGLEHVQEALELHARGVSARKVVVTL